MSKVRVCKHENGERNSWLLFFLFMLMDRVDGSGVLLFSCVFDGTSITTIPQNRSFNLTLVIQRQKQYAKAALGHMVERECYP